MGGAQGGDIGTGEAKRRVENQRRGFLSLLSSEIGSYLRLRLLVVSQHRFVCGRWTVSVCGLLEGT